MVIDEAQLLPEVFSALRVAIDADRKKKGRFVITGSSSPLLQRQISESLAGRAATIELSPLCVRETFDHSDFCKHLCTGSHPDEWIDRLQEKRNLQDVHKYWLQGGYPEPWVENNERFRKLWMESYTNDYIQRDVSRLFPKMDTNKYRLFISMLSSLSGEIINYSDVGRSLEVAHTTARDYFEIAHGTFIWRRLSAYEKNSKKRIVKHPKGFFRDSGLLNHLQHIQSVNQLMSHPRAGILWESLVTEELLRNLNLQGTSYTPYYYRTSAGAEVDLVLEGDFGLVPIEIKYSSSVTRKQIIGLENFVNDHGCDFGFVITTGNKVYKIKENIYVVPFQFI